MSQDFFTPQAPENQKPASAAQFMSAAKKIRAAGGEVAPGHASRQKIFCPMLPNPTTGERGYHCTLKRASPTEGLMIASRVEEGLRALNPHFDDGEGGTLRARFVDTYKLPELESPDAQEKLLYSAWMLTVCVVDPVLDFQTWIEWLSNTEIEGIPTGDVADFLQFHVKTFNEESPHTAAYRGGLDTLRKLPAALWGIERAFDAGEETLRRYLNEDAEAGVFIRKWGDVLAAVALERLEQRAQIYADANAKAIVGEIIQTIFPLIFRRD